MDSSTGISFDLIDKTLGETARKADADFFKDLADFQNGEHTTADALAFQRSSQAWKISQDVVATVTQNFGDVFGKIIQKA